MTRKERELIDIIKLYQSDLSDEQRINFWNMIRSDYCKYCGTKLKKDESCYCTANE